MEIVIQKIVYYKSFYFLINFGKIVKNEDVLKLHQKNLKDYPVFISKHFYFIGFMQIKIAKQPTVFEPSKSLFYFDYRFLTQLKSFFETKVFIYLSLQFI